MDALFKERFHIDFWDLNIYRFRAYLRYIYKMPGTSVIMVEPPKEEKKPIYIGS